jgi:hypothetical protein
VPAAKFLGSNNGMRCAEAGQAIVSEVEWSHRSKIGDITLIFVKALSVAAVRKTPALLEPSPGCGRRFVQRPCRTGILSC